LAPGRWDAEDARPRVILLVRGLSVSALNMAQKLLDICNYRLDNESVQLIEQFLKDARHKVMEESALQFNLEIPQKEEVPPQLWVDITDYKPPQEGRKRKAEEQLEPDEAMSEGEETASENEEEDEEIGEEDEDCIWADTDKLVFKQLKCPHCNRFYDHLKSVKNRGEICPNCGYNVFITPRSLEEAGLKPVSSQRIPIVRRM